MNKITVKEAAEILEVSESFVKDLIKRKRLKAEKFGHVWALNEISVNERRMKMRGLRDVKLYTSQWKDGWFMMSHEPEPGLFDKFIVRDVPEEINDETVIETANKKVTHLDTRLLPPLNGRLDSPGLTIGGCTWKGLIERKDLA